MKWLAFDVGGANVKASDGERFVSSHAFLLWLDPKRLAGELRTLIAEAPESDHLALTMTGELADCFPSKSDGVRTILEAVEQAADGRHTRVYLLDGRMVAPAAARRMPKLAAASNWHAMAVFASRYAPSGPALLMDIGSTTTDIIPLRDGQVATESRSDTDRLLRGELVYTGIERSPICGLISSAPYRQRKCPVMQEFFASTLDIYLLTGELPESPGSLHTADRRPATKAAARIRVGRMIGAPEEHFHHRDAVLIAQHARKAQIKRIVAGLQQVVEALGEPPQTVVLSGHGEFLARQVLSQQFPQVELVSLSQKLGSAVSRAATAYALAVLAREAIRR